MSADVFPRATVGSQSSALPAGVYPQASTEPADVSPQVSATVAEVPQQTPPSEPDPKIKAASRIAAMFDSYDAAVSYAQAHHDPDAAAAAGFLRGVSLDAHPKPRGPPAKVSAKVTTPKPPPPAIPMTSPKPRPPPVPRRPMIPVFRPAPQGGIPILGKGGMAPSLAKPPAPEP